VTALLADISGLHSPVPVHEPVQPANDQPVPGVCASVTTWLCIVQNSSPVGLTMQVS
jgi:hypothetical protein